VKEVLLKRSWERCLVKAVLSCELRPPFVIYGGLVDSDNGMGRLGIGLDDVNANNGGDSQTRKICVFVKGNGG
jgi:hypothetical protein